jgi:hypothetical protein
MTTIIKSIYICIFMSLVITLSSLTVLSSNGIAVTGTFADYQYKLLPGEIIESNEIFVVFINHYPVHIEINLNTNVYDAGGKISIQMNQIEFLLDTKTISIKAHDSIKIPIGIRIHSDAPAGQYQLGILADVIPNQTDGITVTGSAELRTTLSIYGEAGDIEIQTFDIFGNILLAELSLYRRDGSSTFPIRTVSDGVIIDRFVPGDYFVVGRYKDFEVLRKEFVIVNKEVKVLHLIAQTVFIDDITVTPLISTTTQLLIRVRINYTITNIHNTLEDLRLVIDTSFENISYELEEAAMIPYLPESIFEGSFLYVSPFGWDVGVYSFKVEIYIGPYKETLSMYVGESNVSSLNVLEQYVDTSKTSPSNDKTLIEMIPIWVFFISSVIGIGILIIYVFKIKKQTYIKK